MLLGGYIDSSGYLEGNGPSDFPKVLFHGTHCRGGIMHSRAMLSKCGPGILGVPEPSGVPAESTLFWDSAWVVFAFWGLPFLQIHSVSQTPEHVISQQIGVEANVSIQLAFIKPDIKEISKKAWSKGSLLSSDFVVVVVVFENSYFSLKGDGNTFTSVLPV